MEKEGSSYNTKNKSSFKGVDNEGNTTLKLTTFPLNGKNYSIWLNPAERALSGKRALGFVNGRITRPTDTSSEEYENWYYNDNLVYTWILNSMEPSLVGAFSKAESSKALWESIKRQFGHHGNLMRIYELKHFINNINLGGGDPIEYNTKMKEAWDELQSLRPNTTIIEEVEKRVNEDLVISYLMGLDSDYNDLRNHILRIEPLPHYDDVVNKVNKEYMQRKILNGSSNKAERGSLVDSKEEGMIVQGVKVKVKCDKCGRMHNPKDKCWKCGHCKMLGHTKEKCWILNPHLRPNHYKEKASPQSAQNAIEKDNSKLLEDLAKLLQNHLPNSSQGMVSNSHFNFDPWIIDSGATNHMFRNKNKASRIETLGNFRNVTIANGSEIPIKGLGDIKVLSKETKGLYMPNFSSNLLSVSKITKDLNCCVIFEPNKVIFQDILTGKKIGEGRLHNGLYFLDSTNQALRVEEDRGHQKLWHARLGHPPSNILCKMIPNMKFSDFKQCRACNLGKQTKLPFVHSETCYNETFDLIHSDLWTSPLESHNGFKYFVTFIDHKSRYTWIYLIKNKSETLSCFKEFVSLIENQLGKRIKILRTDNGGEYTSNVFEDYLKTLGIIHQTTCPYTPEQNGVAERKNRHILDVGRSLMFHYNVPKRYWNEAILTAIHLINRMPSKLLNGKSPFEFLYNRQPNLSYLKVFGCTCYVHILNHARDKLSYRSVKCIFLGYCIDKKGYKYLDPYTNEKFLSRNVTFLENDPYFDKVRNEGETEDPFPLSIVGDWLSLLRNNDQINNHGIGLNESENKDSNSQDLPPQNDDIDESLELNEEQNIVSESQNEETPSDKQPNAELDSQDEIPFSSSQVDQNEQESTSPSHDQNFPLRRSQRIRKSPSEWKKNRVFFYGNKVTAYPIENYYTLDNVKKSYRVFLTKLDNLGEPSHHYNEAKDIPIWRNAMNKELDALTRNKT